MAGHPLILWGAGYLNTLRLGRPIYSAVSGREAREGSEWVETTSGVRDSWIVGRDYVMDFEARWIPDGGDGSSVTPWSGPTGWQAFLDWARDSNTFRLVPDDAYPAAYVDSCYLADPLRGAGAIDALVRRTMTLRVQNATVDFQQRMRGILFEYVPGASLTDPVTATMTRADAATLATYLTGAGQYATAAANVLRDGHFSGATRATRVEGTRANGWTKSGKLDDAAWTKINATVSADALAAPDGTTTADLLVEGASTAVHGLSRATPTLTNNTRSTVYLCQLASTRSWFRVVTTDKSGTARSTWFNGNTGAVGTKNSGHDVWVSADLINVAGGVWRAYAVSFDAASGGTAPSVEVNMATADGGGSYAGDGTSGMFVWGLGIEVDAAFPSSPIFTDASTLTRAADGLVFPISWGVVPDITVLVEGLRPNWADASGGIGVNPSLLSVGNDFALDLYANAATRVVAAEIRKPAIATSAASAIPAGALSVVAQYTNLTTGGKCRVDGGGGSFGAYSSANSYATTFGDSTLRIGDGSNGKTAFLDYTRVRVLAGLKTRAEAQAA